MPAPAAQTDMTKGPTMDDFSWMSKPARAIFYRVSLLTTTVLIGVAAIVGGSVGEVLYVVAGAIGVATAGLATANTPRK